MRNLTLLAALVSVPVAAGEVYKCKGPKGEITYTNIKCPEHTDTERYASYQPEPEPAPPVTTAAVEAPPNFSDVTSSDLPEQPVDPVVPPPVPSPAQTFPTPVAQLPAEPDSPVVEASSIPAAGYKCSDGQTIWLQSTPCPAAQARAVRGPGEPSIPAVAPVTPVTAAMPIAITTDASSSPSALCDQLIAQASSPDRRKDGAGTDELNKLLAANGCKR